MQELKQKRRKSTPIPVIALGRAAGESNPTTHLETNTCIFTCALRANNNHLNNNNNKSTSHEVSPCPALPPTLSWPFLTPRSVTSCPLWPQLTSSGNTLDLGQKVRLQEIIKGLQGWKYEAWDVCDWGWSDRLTTGLPSSPFPPLSPIVPRDVIRKWLSDWLTFLLPRDWLAVTFPSWWNIRIFCQ